MGRSDLQGSPWHEEYLSSHKNVYNCEFCDKEYNNCCQLKRSNYFGKSCVGKNNCDFYQSKSIPRSTHSRSNTRKIVETWQDYYLKKHDYDSLIYYEKHNPKHLFEPLPSEMKIIINTHKSPCKYLKDSKCGKSGFINRGLNCAKPKLCKFYET